MEQLVEQYAAMLMSDERAGLYGTLRGLEELKAEGAQNSVARVKYSRLLQELLAYKGGALVKSILRKAVDVTASTEISSGYLTVDVEACLKLVALSDSQTIARFCLQEMEDTLLLVGALIAAHNAFKESSEDHDRPRSIPSCTELYFALLALRGIVNFARASKAFCRTLQEVNSLFPTFEQFLHKIATMESVPSRVVEGAADDTLKLIVTFALSDECQDWAIDRGLIRLRAATVKLALKGDAIEQRFKDRIKAGSRQNVKQPAEIRAYLEKSAQEILEIDRQIQDPKTEKKRSKKLRAGFLRNIREEMCLSDDAKDLPAKFLAARATGRIEAPIVCSWDLCDAGTALDAGKRYSKCANCSLAFYCSKEHQKMHWNTHKKHCKQAKNRGESDRAVAPSKTADATERTACSLSQRQQPDPAADASSPRSREAAVRTRVQQMLSSASVTDDVRTLAPEVFGAQD